jgi:membrane-associated phospholipid phosphatase
MEDPAGWIQVAFVVLLAGVAWIRPLARKRKLKASALAVIVVGAIALEWCTGRCLSPLSASVVRDWLPALLLLFPYWQVGQFFTGADPLAEKQLAIIDQTFFRALGIAPAETSVGPVTSMSLELAYLMVYPLIPLGVATLYATHSRRFASYYWIVVLLATYICLAITPFVRAMPPRALDCYEKFRMPPSKLGALNRFILRRGSIQAITFPSAHVASSMAATLVLLRVQPWAGLIFLVIALSIVVATVVGGYHYAADVLLAVLLAVVVFAATYPALRAR